MKALTLLVVCCVTLFGCAGDEFDDHPAEESPELAIASHAPYREGELLVGYRSGDELRAASASALLPGATIIDRIEFPRSPVATVGKAGFGPSAAVVYHLRLPKDTSVEAAIAILQLDPSVAYAEPNHLVRRAQFPDDPYFGRQWGLYNTGQTLTGDKGTSTGAAGADIQALEAWDLRSGGEVVVAVLDSGVDYHHPDLAGNIWINPGEVGGNGLDDDGNGYIDDVRGWNFVSNNNNPMDDDVNISTGKPEGHGSHVAGIIGASGNNGIGVAGIGWAGRIMPLKFLNSRGDGDVANAVKAINYAVRNGAKVINASYTYPQSCLKTSPNISERNAIAAADAAGVLFVAAAGNFGCNNDIYPFYPASHNLPNIISVTATDPNDARISWSNYGVNSVHLGAPGLNVFSTIRGDFLGVGGIRGYGYMSGTSMASPFAAGAAALVWAHRPELTHLEVKEALLSSVDPLPALATRTVSGGRLNVYQAMTFDATAEPPPAPTELTAAVLPGARVELAWRTVAEATGYRIERQTTSGEFQAIGTIEPAATFIDTTVPDGQRNIYQVRARSGGTFSEPSDTTEIFVPMRPPTALSATPYQAENSAYIQLYWSDNSATETGYEIEISVTGRDSAQLKEVAANSTFFRDEEVSPGYRYTYRVRALHDTVAPSDWSAEASAIPPDPAASGSDSQCFIATAAFGSPQQPEVTNLRRFRDRVLLPHPIGRQAVALYYFVSPPLARLIAGSELLRAATRRLLAPLLWLATAGEAQAMSRKTEAPATSTDNSDYPYVPEELLVRFAAGVPAQEAEELIRRQGAQVLARLESGGLYHLRLPPGKSVPVAAEEFAALPQVTYAEPNLRVRRRAGPSQ